MPSRVAIFARAAGLLAAAAAAGTAAFVWQNRTDVRDEQIAQLQRENEYLQDVADRLTLEQRVARIVVTQQSRDADGNLVTDLLFFDIGESGEADGPGRKFTVVGDTFHVEGMVIRFDDEFVKQGDALRGRSIGFWHRIYGSATAPDDGQFIDPERAAPRVYRGGPIDVSAVGLDEDRAAFEQQLWDDFWRMALDEKYAAEQGVVAASGLTPWHVPVPGYVYELTLQANGGLSMQASPMPPMYRQLLDRPTTRP